LHRFIFSAALAVMLPAVAAAAAPATLVPPPPTLSIADGAAIVAILATAPAQGLTAADVSGDVPALADPDPAARLAADARLSRAAITFVGAEHGMDLDPHAVDPNFALRPAYDASAEFYHARAAGQVGDWLTAQTRHDPAYLALLAARARYAAIAAAGGWPPIPAGAPLKAGARDPRVPALLQRLTVEGYLPAAARAAPAPPSNAPPAPAPDPLLFDAPLAAALTDFQTHHALDATGVLDAPTLAALNVSAADRLAAIDVNLERFRWLPIALPAQRIEADIGGPDVTLIVGDKPALTMRAVAGSPTRETPTFASAVDAVEFNPPWYVPADIARRELLPKGDAYLSSHGFVVHGDSVMQRAGPESALGYVKFDVPDRFEVYLHDTPARGAFASSQRWRSHGCMRLQMPRELAAALLAPQGWTPASIDAAIAAKATRSIPLATKTPVFVIYRTALAGDDGKVTFRADVYHWDAELAAALAGHPLLRHPAAANIAAP
jgi:murein L,D-transpeptidase YcbB/YkuD